MGVKRRLTLTKFLQKAPLALCGGLFVSGAVLWAAPASDLTLQVGIQDTFPPAAVADVAAAPTITPGQVVLAWTSPQGNGGYADGQTAASYIVKLATFSVSSLLGDTTAWWTAASTAPFPPAPQSPGNPETMLADLAEGTTYWFALRSLDASGNLSPIDANATSPALQATAVTGRADATIPGPVAGFAVTAGATGTYTINWPPVTVSVDGSAAGDIAGYRLYRSTSVFGPFATFVSSVTGAAATGLDVTVDPLQDTFYALRAVDAAGNGSPLADSNYFQFSPTVLLGLVGVATDGTRSRVLVPEGAIPELATPGGNYLLRVAPNTDPALNRDTKRTLATYTVGLSNSAGNAAPGTFVFREPVLNVALQYGSGGGPVIDPNRVGVLWWNGVTWVKVGRAQVDDLLNTVSFETALPGVYQVRNFTVSTGLSLDRAAVFPRIFSPNGDGVNDVVYFVVDNPRASSVSGKILDLSNGTVADLAPAGTGAPTPDSLVWDGRNKSGQIVPGGVYIYRIQGEGKTFTGTVVIAH